MSGISTEPLLPTAATAAPSAPPQSADCFLKKTAAKIFSAYSLLKKTAAKILGPNYDDIYEGEELTGFSFRVAMEHPNYDKDGVFEVKFVEGCIDVYMNAVASDIAPRSIHNAVKGKVLLGVDIDIDTLEVDAESRVFTIRGEFVEKWPSSLQLAEDEDVAEVIRKLGLLYQQKRDSSQANVIKFMDEKKKPKTPCQVC